MKKPVVLIGVGEVGGVFARGVLKLGHPVYPVTRDMSVSDVAKDLTDPEAVIVGVGEKDLNQVLAEIPQNWHDRVVLIQNELLPKDWESANYQNPTVISVWFEKKQPNDFKVIIPSPVYGPKAQFVADALGAIGIATKVLSNDQELLSELVLKNLYILTTNISGLAVGGNVGELWDNHQDLAKEVADNVLDIQFNLIGTDLDREQLIDGMVEAFNGDLAHKCMGRSAPARLERALEQASQAGISVERLENIKGAQVSQ